LVNEVRSHRPLAIILAAFTLLGVTYSVVTPIFEAGDEIWHYPFVQHLAAGNSLPIQDPAVKTLWAQEGGQPPLYYALAALATFWIDTRDLPDRLWYNPHARIGIPLLYGNKNLIVHTSAEGFPWHNTALAVHLIRFLSLLLSASTVALTYFLALEIQPNNQILAVVAAAFVAFNPMFLFISASVNNDSLAVMLATLALLLLARLVTRGATMWRFVVLGIVLGLAALSKVSNLGLLVLAALVFLFVLPSHALSEAEGEAKNLPPPLPSPASGGGRGRGCATQGDRLRQIIAGCLTCAALVVAMAGWWYVRNWLLYGDPLAFNVWLEIVGKSARPTTLLGLLDEFQGFRISFWGNFGGVNLIAPDWVYVVLDVFTVLALIGLLIGLVRRALPRLLALPALWLALISISLVRWTLLTLASQGRLIFPAISAVAILLAYGLTQCRIADSKFKIHLARSWNYELRISNFGFAPLSFVIFLFAFAVLAPFTLIAPAYALPARWPNDTSVPNPTHILFENQAELVGYVLPQRSVPPGGELPLTVYWRARVPIAEDFSVYIHLFDADGNVVGQWDAFPGNGLYPTRLWQPGEVIVDSYRVPIAVNARGPSMGRVEVGLYRRTTLKNLVARDPQDRIITPTIARFKIAGHTQVQVENAVRNEFADKIALVGYAVEKTARAGDSIHVRLYWRALAPMNEDYTVFVHLVNAGGQIITQKDDQPQGGRYPTSFWDVGDTVADEYALAVPRDAPPGDYQIRVGIYRASDGARLPVSGDGNAVNLLTIDVR
jgi:hypothetical protein